MVYKPTYNWGAPSCSRFRCEDQTAESAARHHWTKMTKIWNDMDMGTPKTPAFRSKITRIQNRSSQKNLGLLGFDHLWSSPSTITSITSPWISPWISHAMAKKIAMLSTFSNNEWNLPQASPESPDRSEARVLSLGRNLQTRILFCWFCPGKLLGVLQIVA